MALTNLKQNDSRWASHAYAGETLAAAGCGPTSVADLIGHNTPVSVADWMQSNGYASNGQGTYHSGIAAALKHYGYSGQQITGSSLAGVTSSSLFTTFQSYIQSGYCGIILFGGTATGCVNNYWTSGGHYVSIVGYSGGKYKVYDPASAARDGMHPFSDFAGDIKHLFASTVKWEQSGGGSGEGDYTLTLKDLKLGSTGNDVKVLQSMLKGWGYNLTVDGSFGSATQNAVKDFQRKHGMAGDGNVGTNTYNRLFYRV